MAKKAKQKFYAYFVPGENRQGITEQWAECETIVSGKVGARFKAFEVREDAEAWLARGAVYESRGAAGGGTVGAGAGAGTAPARRLTRGIYFDAGTGRGAGVEISVTDERGKNLLHKALPVDELNRFGKHLLKNAGATNNYGELLALKYALRIARKEKIKKIFGDSQLVIEYWSKWRVKRKVLPSATVALADEVAKLREAFEKEGRRHLAHPGRAQSGGFGIPPITYNLIDEGRNTELRKV